MARRKVIRLAYAPGIRAHSFAIRVLALTGAALGALSPAGAVTLGELAVESKLGEPLSARVPVQLATGEVLGATCVSVPVGGASELTRLPQPRVTVPETAAGSLVLQVTTEKPLYEPMYELQLQVRCPGTALLVRQYVLMLDLPVTAPPVVAAAMAPAAAAPAGRLDMPTPPPVQPRSARPRLAALPGTPLQPGSRYRVSQGDTLSTIAARVSGRDMGLWNLADRIFAANPDAFIGGNPDLIKLGSEILIPAAGDAAASAPAVTPAATTAAAELAATMAKAPPLGTSPVAAPVMPAADMAPEPVVVPEPIVAQAQAPVFEDERRVADPVEIEAEVEVTPVVAAPPPVESQSGAPVWLAAVIGLLIGAIASLALLRERLVEALRSLLPGNSPFVPSVTARSTTDTGGRPVTKRMLPAESTMVVVEERHQDAVAGAAAAPAAGTDSDSELADLFSDGPAEGALLDADDSLLPEQAGLDIDLDLTAAAAKAGADAEIGWIGDDAALTPTQKTPVARDSGGDTGGPMDLQTLVQRAADDDQVSQTLKDALNLLESDYEDELTASQVIDRSKLKDILEDDGDDTLARTGTDKHRR